MKTLTLHDASSTRNLNAATRGGYLLLTHRGRPIAYFLPTRFYDEEDIGYMTDPGFWKMVRKWREDKGPSIPWEQVKAELIERERSERAKKPATARRKGKRNGTA
jgi:hypothetical protein